MVAQIFWWVSIIFIIVGGITVLRKLGEFERKMKILRQCHEELKLLKEDIEIGLRRNQIRSEYLKQEKEKLKKNKQICTE